MPALADTIQGLQRRGGSEFFMDATFTGLQQ